MRIPFHQSAVNDRTCSLDCVHAGYIHREVLRNAERNLLLPSVSSASVSPPRRASSFPISPRNGVKDFRLRFVAAFVPLCSVSSPLHVALLLPPPAPRLHRITRENSTLLSSPILHLTILRSSFRTNLCIFPFSHASCLFFFS